MDKLLDVLGVKSPFYLVVQVLDFIYNFFKDLRLYLSTDTLVEENYITKYLTCSFACFEGVSCRFIWINVGLEKPKQNIKANNSQ